MYKTPSGRKKKQNLHSLNLVPILDSVFILVFFLLSSYNLTKIFEIESNVPIVSSKTPPDKKIPLALTIKISEEEIIVYTGSPAIIHERIGKVTSDYDLEKLHTGLVALKQKYPHEKSVIIEPLIDLPYEKVITIMDAVRLLRNTDETIYVKGSDGVDTKTKELFNQIIFGNIKS